MESKNKVKNTVIIIQQSVLNTTNIIIYSHKMPVNFPDILKFNFSNNPNN